MHLLKDDLERAVQEGVLAREQADALWAHARARRARPPAPVRAWRESAAAAGVALAAAVLFAIAIVAAWEQGGAGARLATSLACAGVLAWAGHRAARRAHEGAAAALLSLAVGAAASAAHALAHWGAVDPEALVPPLTLGDWPSSHGFATALVTVAAAAAALALLRLPPLAATLVAAVWFGVQQGAPVVFGATPSWPQRAALSALVGAAAIAAGVVLDRRTHRDFSRWTYLSGLVALWGGLTSAHAGPGVPAPLSLAVNGGLLGASLLLRRRSFAVFGGIGLAGALGHATAAVLVDAAAVPVLGAIGAALGAGAWLWRRRAPEWEQDLWERLPPAIQRLLPPLDHA